MGPRLSAQLCLGLSLCWGIWAQEGLLPSPTLRAKPGLVIPQGKRVTLWCEGRTGADEYRLWMGRSIQNMEKWVDEAKARVLLSSMTAETAGRYQCLYRKQSLWSKPSEPLELRVTCLDHPTSLTALPNSYVASGQKVTLMCQSQAWDDRSALYKDGEEITYRGAQPHGWGAHTNFTIPAVTPAHEGTYRCYSFNSSNPYVWSTPSDALVLRVTDPLARPSLRAEPGLVIPWGKPVTLRCEGSPGTDLYHLRKEGGGDLNMEKSVDGREAQVLINHMGAENAGRYQCLYRKQSLWSETSDPLDLRVTDADLQDYTLGNGVRLLLAGLVLMILGILLIEACTDCRGTEKSPRGPQP